MAIRLNSTDGYRAAYIQESCDYNMLSRSVYNGSPQSAYVQDENNDDECNCDDEQTATNNGSSDHAGCIAYIKHIRRLQRP